MLKWCIGMALRVSSDDEPVLSSDPTGLTLPRLKLSRLARSTGSGCVERID